MTKNIARRKVSMRSAELPGDGGALVGPGEAWEGLGRLEEASAGLGRVVQPWQHQHFHETQGG